MNRRRWVSFAAVAFVLGSFGVCQATIAQYRHAAPCGQLAGFAGLLQTAGFVPTGDCLVDVKKGGCHDSRVCKISNPPSGGATTGHCTPTPDLQSCACVATAN